MTNEDSSYLSTYIEGRIIDIVDAGLVLKVSAVICHMGGAIASGHCIIYIWNNEVNKYHCVNDSHELIACETIPNDGHINPYIIVYECTKLQQKDKK